MPRQGLGGPPPRLGLAPVTRPRSSNPQGRERGQTVYPTVLEAYNRDSDYKRWQAGQQIADSLGSRWGNLQQDLLLRNLTNDGTARTWQPLKIIRFPGDTSPEGAWTVCWRPRGSLLLPMPLTAAALTLDQSRPKLKDHRLNLDVSATLSTAELEAFKAHIGLWFENGATGGTFPDDLPDADGITIAFTLVAVDATSGVLRFDLSRPYARKRIQDRLYWTPLPYRPEAPLFWNTASQRYLINSDIFHCNCPDHSGQSIANFDPAAADSRRFPGPTTGGPPQNPAGALPRQQTAYIQRWRQLPQRFDQRRECKHVHAARTLAGIPFAEPSDYGAFGALRQATTVQPATLDRFKAVRDFTFDYVAPALAAISSLDLDPRDTPDADALLTRHPQTRLLWTSADMPAAHLCQAGDWWLKRSGDTLHVFDGATQRFRASINEDAALIPVLQQQADLAAASVALIP